MLIVGVETSCDDTGIGVICTKSKHIMSNVVSSQFHLNKIYGGIMPIAAARAHRENLPLVTDAAFQEAGISWEDVGAIAYTKGPGLSMCLSAGCEFVNNVHLENPHIKCVPVHHLEGHALVNRLFPESHCEFPYLALILSGGHSLLSLVNSSDNYTVIGTTQDDAVGEVFDKVGRLIGISSGDTHVGKLLEQIASKGDRRSEIFPVPMLRSDTVNFSFSGLKSAVARRCGTSVSQPNVQLDSHVASNIAAGFQYAAVEHIVNTTRRALVWAGCSPPPDRILTSKLLHSIEMDRQRWLRCVSVKSLKKPTALVVSGGVAANSYLRQRLHRFQDIFNIPVLFPPPSICTDNGVMVAWAAAEHLAGNATEYSIESKSINAVSPQLQLNFRTNV